MFVPLLLAVAIQLPPARPALPVFPAFRMQLFMPLPPGIARLLGEKPARSGQEVPLLRVRGVTVTLPADFRVL